LSEYVKDVNKKLTNSNLCITVKKFEPPVYWVPGALSPWDKVDLSPPLEPWWRVELYLQSPTIFIAWCSYNFFFHPQPFTYNSN